MQIERSRRTGEHFGVLLLDGVSFKLINDTHGHHVGDLVLQRIAERTQATIRKADTVARLGGDEFAVILAGVTHDHVQRVAAKIVEAIEQPMADRCLPEEIVPRVTIGIAVFPDHGADLDQLLRAADQAMYRAKQRQESWAVHQPASG